MQADQSAFVDFSTGIKGDGLLWPGSHCSFGCKRSDGLRCWSRDIAGTQRHPTMQNYQQNSYNINAGYYINLLTVGYNLPAVFCVDINALSVIQRVSAIAGRMCRHCWFVIFSAFLCTPPCFLNVFCQRVCVGNDFCDSDGHLTLYLCYARCFTLYYGGRWTFTNSAKLLLDKLDVVIKIVLLKFNTCFWSIVVLVLQLLPRFCDTTTIITCTVQNVLPYKCFANLKIFLGLTYWLY